VTETPNNPQHPATVVDLDEAADLDEAVSTFVTDLAEARLSSVDSFGSISCATTTSARAGIASLLHYPRTDHSWCSHRPGPSKSERSQTGNCARRPRRSNSQRTRQLPQIRSALAAATAGSRVHRVRGLAVSRAVWSLRQAHRTQRRAEGLPRSPRSLNERLSTSYLDLFHDDEKKGSRAGRDEMSAVLGGISRPTPCSATSD